MNYKAEVLEIRKQRKVSVTQLSKSTGIPADRIYKWESGVGNPKADDSEKLQKWLNGSSSENATTRPQAPQKDGNGAKEDYLSGKNLENFSEAQRKLSETNSQLATAIVHAQSGSRQDHGLVPSLVDLIQEIAGGKKQVPIDELLTQLRKALVRDNGYT